MQEPQLFPLGRLFASPGALAALSRWSKAPSFLLDRHARGDWGRLPEDDLALNDAAVQTAGRVFSEYSYRGITWWVVTDGDRSRTTILLPEEWFLPPIALE